MTTAYPLNSRQLTAHVIARIARKLELHTTAPLADLRQLVEGRLVEGGHEPTNVLVVQSEHGSIIALQDEGVFSRYPQRRKEDSQSREDRWAKERAARLEEKMGKNPPLRRTRSAARAPRRPVPLRVRVDARRSSSPN